MLRRSSRIAALASVFAGVFVVGAGCISSDNERTLELAVGTRCTLNSDCTDPNVCVFGTCHAECNSSADCQHGERCVKGEKGGVNVCQLASESKCDSSADCAGEQVCGVDGACRDGCKGTDECLVGQVCTQGTCADQEEVDPMSGALPEDPAHIGEGQPCTYNTDCPDELACVDSACAFQCIGDKDCPPGETCVDHFCTVDIPVPLECQNSLQCGPGFLCVQNACVPGCSSDAECAIGERCFGATCVAPVFDGANRPTAVSANDASIFTVYNGQVLRCPNTGCTPSNVEQLFVILPTVVPGAVPFGGAANTERLFADGPATFVIASNYYLYQEDIYGCRDTACTDYVEVSTFGLAETKAVRENAGGIVVYQVRNDGKGGLAFSSCGLAPASVDCKSSFDVGMTFNGGYPSSMAIEKGATPTDDKVYVGFDNGRIERFDVADCVDGVCSSTLVTTITDGIGLPVEVTELHFLDGQLLILTGTGNSEGGYTYVIDRCASSSCTPTLYFQHASFFLPQLAVGAGNVYVADDGNVWKSPFTTN